MSKKSLRLSRCQKFRFQAMLDDVRDFNCLMEQVSQTIPKPEFRKKYNPERNSDANFEWRRKVLIRDNFRCQGKGCGITALIEVHHIKDWTHYPDKRYEVDNGITLCRPCHSKIHSQN